MNILFSLLELSQEGQGSNMYSDLAEVFSKHGHQVTIVAPAVEDQKTGLYIERGMRVLRVRALDSRIAKNQIIKGVIWTALPFLYKKAYLKYLKNDPFDIIFMPTPPITFINFAVYVKRKTGAKLYVILRDIHPESMQSVGVYGNAIIYKFLKANAQKAYRIADYIGCMSPGNIEFVKKIASDTNHENIVLLPNWINLEEFANPNMEIRKKYGLDGKTVAVFGGTIGISQAVWNIIWLAEHFKNVTFLIVGKGVEKEKMELSAKEKALDNMLFLNYIPRNEYTALLGSADIGLISLHERYKVPTCPSKIIGYMSQRIPVFAMINEGNDYGRYYIDKPNCGLWVNSTDKKLTFDKFSKIVSDKQLRQAMGDNGYNYYLKNLTTEHAYETIIKQTKLA